MTHHQSEREARTAIVTGSTAGIGKAIAERLLTSGYNVVLNYANDDTRAATAFTELRRIATNVSLVKADVSRSDATADLIRKALEAFGSIDVLVNNSARVIDRPLTDMTESEWDTVIDTTLKGTFLCAQHAARHMLTQDNGGAIINIGSSTGIRGRRNGVNTCAAKAGIMVMTKCMALELAPKIRVNTIVPGLTLTDETSQRFRLDDPDARKTREQAIPMGRLGTPQDVANVALFLLSEQAQFITGQQVVVDGGQYL